MTWYHKYIYLKVWSFEDVRWMEPVLHIAKLYCFIHLCLLSAVCCPLQYICCFNYEPLSIFHYLSLHCLRRIFKWKSDRSKAATYNALNDSGLHWYLHSDLLNRDSHGDRNQCSGARNWFRIWEGTRQVIEG